MELPSAFLFCILCLLVLSLGLLTYYFRKMCQLEAARDKQGCAPQRVGFFRRISYEQYCNDMNNALGDWDEEAFLNAWCDLTEPARATSGSAGYDVFAPFEMHLSPGETVTVPTGFSAYMDKGWWLGCLPRSGLGFKYKLQLVNTLGVIDGDYVEADNEGHILLRMTNNSDKTLDLPKGKAFAQFIFLPYGVTYNDRASGKRSGGFGSTG